MSLAESLHLITDRSAADVMQAEQINSKAWQNLSELERNAYEAGLKGSYKFSDINRVEAAVAEISSAMVTLAAELDEQAAESGVDWDKNKLPYDPADFELTTKTDWTAADMMPWSDRERYIGNVTKIRDALCPELPLPLSLEGLTWAGANEIEAALIAAADKLSELREELLGDIEAEATQLKFHSGEIYSGEV